MTKIDNMQFEVEIKTKSFQLTYLNRSKIHFMFVFSFTLIENILFYIKLFITDIKKKRPHLVYTS